MSEVLSPAPLIVSNQAVTTKSLPGKTFVLCSLVSLRVLIENCCNFQDVSFLIDTKIYKKPKISVRVSSIGSKLSLLGSNVACKIFFPNDQICSASLISKDKISLSMEVAQVHRVFHNLNDSPFPVSGNSTLYHNNQIQIHGILGCDLIPLWMS